MIVQPRTDISFICNILSFRWAPDERGINRFDRLLEVENGGWGMASTDLVFNRKPCIVTRIKSFGSLETGQYSSPYDRIKTNFSIHTSLFMGPVSQFVVVNLRERADELWRPHWD